MQKMTYQDYCVCGIHSQIQGGLLAGIFVIACMVGRFLNGILNNLLGDRITLLSSVALLIISLGGYLVAASIM